MVGPQHLATHALDAPDDPECLQCPRYSECFLLIFGQAEEDEAGGSAMDTQMLVISLALASDSQTLSHDVACFMGMDFFTGC